MSEDVGFKRADGSWFMNAYYYSFAKTGCDAIDAILSCVAAAGKGFHHTEYWNDDREGEDSSYIDEIERAAFAAKDLIASLQQQLEWISVDEQPGPADARMVEVWGITDENKRFSTVGVYHSPDDWEMVSDATDYPNHDGYFSHYGMKICGWRYLPPPPSGKNTESK